MKRMAIFVLCGIAANLAAQQLAPAFEVASVKRNASGEIEGSIGPRPGGYAATNIPLRLLIIRAYELRSFQVAGGPSWIDGERFDVTARAPEGTPANQVFSMLRTLLAERFKLVAHAEKREQPVYALVTARADGRLGPKLKASTLNCAEQPSQGDRSVHCPAGAAWVKAGTVAWSG